MLMVVRRCIHLFLLATFAVTAPTLALAQNYPDKPVRVIVPFAAGGNADVLARILSEALTRRLGQTFIVDNRPGGSNIIGTQFVARSNPDGYTLLIVSNSHTVNPTVFGEKLPYDTIKDFAGVAKIATTPMVLTAYPGFGVKNVQELIAKAKTEPGKINFSSSGNGSSAHMAGALLNQLAGIELVHIPYRGTSQGISDTISGQVQLAFPSLSVARELIKTGALQPLGITTAKRTAAAPDLAPLAETPSLKDFDASIWTAMLAPKDVPAPIINKLNSEISSALHDPKVKLKLTQLGVDIDTGTPEELDQFIASDIKQSQGLMKVSAVKQEMGR